MKTVPGKSISELMKLVRVSVSLENSIARAVFSMELGNLQVPPYLKTIRDLSESHIKGDLSRSVKYCNRE